MAKTYTQLLPSIDRRLSTWVSIAEKSRAQEQKVVHPTITISRQYGCEGFPLAEALKKVFEEKTGEEWNIYDKALLQKVSEEEELSVKLLEGLGDMTELLDSLPITIPGRMPHSQMYRRIAQHLIAIAKIGRAIIIGRGGTVVTQGFPNCYHFRLEASFGFRVALMARRLGLTLPEAEVHVKENQEAREKFISKYLNVKTSDHSFFDAVYNNERHSVAEIAWSIFAYVMQDWQGKKVS
jgi:hypothetical protein